MPSSTLTLCQDFPEQLGKGVHNFSANTYKIALSNTAPNVATMTTLADIGQISAGNGYTSGGTALSSTSFTETGGTATFIAADLVFTAAGGSMATFQYGWIYNDSATSPADALVGYYNYGTPVTLGDTETMTFDFTTSILTIS